MRKKIKKTKGKHNSRAPSEWFYHRLILFDLKSVLLVEQETGIVVKTIFS